MPAEEFMTSPGCLLVTGGSGYIGRALVSKLKNTGYSYRILSRQPGEGVIRGDVRDKASLEKAMSGIEAVIHLAGVTQSHSRHHYYEVNAEGTKNCLEAAEKAGVRKFIFVSSRAVGKEGGAYADSKRWAEEEVRKARCPWVILRPAEVYGRGEQGVDRLVGLIRRSFFVPVIVTSSLLCPVFIDDIVEAILKAVENPSCAGKIYTLAGPHELTYRQLTDRIRAFYHLKRICIPIPLALIRLAGEIMDRLNCGPISADQIDRLLLKKSADNSLAVCDLNYSPRRLEEALQIL